jgi:uncharacterized protein YdeI (YjbR/CyaY-like superfamily)
MRGGAFFFGGRVHCFQKSEEGAMAAKKMSAEVDAYIDRAKPFAIPVLMHLRGLMHKGCPGIEEGMKWSMPFFMYKGTNMANMAAFKAHCSFGFWGREISGLVRTELGDKGEGAGALGKIASVKDLPADAVMLGWIKEAKGFVDRGEHTSPMAGRSEEKAAKKKAEVEVPEELTVALAKDKKAAAVFAAFSPGCKREYAEWIADAKREETKAKRVAQAVEWIGDGKQRNWKYQNCQ